MLKWFQKKEREKTSTVGQLIACNVLGRPVWTPRQYDQLADEGYARNVIVYRCVNLISRGVSSVPFLLYKGEQEIDQHPALRLLRHPSPRQAGSAFMEAVVGYLLLSGNSYIEAVSNSQGQPIELHPLRPDRMQLIPGSRGFPIGYEYAVNGRKKTLPCDPVHGRSAVLHLKNFHPLNDWYGLSPIEAAARSIDQHNAVASHNLSLLQNGGRPSGALVIKPGAYPARLTEEQRLSLREDLKAIYEGHENAGRILMLEGDFEWREMGLSPKDLDFIQGKNVSAREIAQAYGVPPMLVGVPGDATFSNYKEARFHLWEDTILPLTELIVTELSLWLSTLYGEDLQLSYDTDAIPALAPKREEAWGKIAQADFLTVNEKRAAVGYSPLPNGDHLAHHHVEGGQS